MHNFLQALSERARAGVRVNVLIDAIGSLSLQKYALRELTDAGGEIQWYHAIRWNTWLRINNRTHRELLVIDGEIGFLGGAGWGDQWFKSTKDEPRWRDTMVQVEGAAVTGLQSIFPENWLESCGEILNGEEYFPFKEAPETNAQCPQRLRNTNTDYSL